MPLDNRENVWATAKMNLTKRDYDFVNCCICKGWDADIDKTCDNERVPIDISALASGYRSEGPGSIPGTTRKKSSGSGTGSTQPREYN
jgi:hypothetical protein